MIYVCSLARIGEVVERTGAERLLSLLAEGTAITRPAAIAADGHLVLSLHDIAEAQDGLTMPGREHVEALLAFARTWNRAKPLVINCYAGISRSTASAYIIAAALAPERDELELARTLRGLSPSATPNPRLIAIADDMLGRDGRMITAIASIGRGADAYEGAPFALQIDV